MPKYSANNFSFTLSSLNTISSNSGGTLKHVTLTELSGLKGMAFAHLELKPKGIVKPIWHPNTQKIGYCTQGEVLVSMHAPGEQETYRVKKGEMFYIPQGSVHHIENIFNKNSVIACAFNHESPETISLSGAIHSSSDSSLTSTFACSMDFIKGLKKSKNLDIIATTSQSKPTNEMLANRYKFDIEKSAKAILTKGGYLQVGLKVNLPTLQGLGILGFGLDPKGGIEPHWHPNSDEILYITKGKVRCMLHLPDGSVHSQEVGEGEGIFLPSNSFHNAENIGSSEVEGIAFFNNAEMVYMGIGEALGSFSDEILASCFNVDPNYFKDFNKPGSPLVIVPS